MKPYLMVLKKCPSFPNSNLQNNINFLSSRLNGKINNKRTSDLCWKMHQNRRIWMKSLNSWKAMLSKVKQSLNCFHLGRNIWRRWRFWGCHQYLLVLLKLNKNHDRPQKSTNTSQELKCHSGTIMSPRSSRIFSIRIVIWVLMIITIPRRTFSLNISKWYLGSWIINMYSFALWRVAHYHL